MPSRPLVLALALALVACGRTDRAAPSALPACAKMGQNCEFSPGKLGTCVIKEPCDSAGPSCLVCQSQH
jgi:hypothetical protein